MTSRTILIVDDDDDLRGTLVEQLSLLRNSDVLQESNAAGCRRARRPIDLLIMDVVKSDGSRGGEVLRKGGYKAPIIMLTGHDTDSDTIPASAGATTM
jgi:DNA-binding response OmpR family regulator